MLCHRSVSEKEIREKPFYLGIELRRGAFAILEFTGFSFWMILAFRSSENAFGAAESKGGIWIIFAPIYWQTYLTATTGQTVGSYFCASM